jgi:hypothetical protein
VDIHIPYAILVLKIRIHCKYGPCQEQNHLEQEKRQIAPFVPFKLRQKLLFTVLGDLLTVHDGVEKYKKRLK